jgi:hypothetical protein
MTKVYDQTSRRDFVLAALRSTCLRVKLIENEITAIGTVLKGGFSTPDTALEWAEEVAPGCVGFIPETISASPRRAAVRPCDQSPVNSHRRREVASDHKAVHHDR